MSNKEQTIRTYDQNAVAMAEKFAGIGSRVEDVERGLSMANVDEPVVLEIGCGDGRDAAEIVKRAPNYLGIDASEGMLRIARNHVPEGRFQRADVEDYVFPKGIDIIFAFASLLHSDREAVASILARAHAALHPGGVFYISLKRADYHASAKHDQFGTRLFYYYQPDDILEIAGDGYTEVYRNLHQHGDQDWFTLVLRKN